MTNARRQGPAPDDHVGGITRLPQTEVIEAMIADGVAGPHDLAGSFFPPTVVTNLTPQMGPAREKTFGPVLPIMRVGDPAESLAVANDCAHGLDASVFSRDRRPARDLATRLVAEGVNINDAALGVAIPSLSFSEKWSGFGQAHGPEGLLAFIPVRQDCCSADSSGIPAASRRPAAVTSFNNIR